ncbi:MAG TPA: hypothetical protein VM778_07780 [Gemmatimonadota bacterium]|nr:hypothetical protein [Gemmatimonadota bacterium]
MAKDDHDRDESRPQQFPFEGLHVYQRAQEAWSLAVATLTDDPVGSAAEHEIRQAVTGIARATARSRSNGSFTAELENSRGSLHAAAALVEQLARRGTPADEGLRTLLLDSSRMLGALIRSLAPGREPVESEVAA